LRLGVGIIFISHALEEAAFLTTCAALAENEYFHFGVCRLARSPTLFRVVENLWMQFGPILSYLYDAQGRPFHGQKHAHLRVIEAFRKRDPELARKAISQDILIGGKALLEKHKA
jgi:DNA-binding GntR family transcriptional regulator